MIIEIDTGRITRDVARAIKLGFTYRDAIALALLENPILWNAILEGVTKGETDATTKPNKKSS